MTKTTSEADTHQFSKDSYSGGEEQVLKSKVSIFKCFTMDSDGFDFSSYLIKYCCLHAGFHDLNGTSIMESVVLMPVIHSLICPYTVGGRRGLL